MLAHGMENQDVAVMDNQGAIFTPGIGAHSKK